MKDLVIRGKTLRREGLVAAGCLIAGMLVNIGAIVGYHRPWTEFFSQLGYVIALAAILYIVTGLVRLLFHFIVLLIRKFK